MFARVNDSNEPYNRYIYKFLRHLNHMEGLDQRDLTIIQTIKNDARLSARQISKKTGIPVATVNRRMQEMIKQGYIKKFVTVLDDEKLGKKTLAYILIKCTQGADYSVIMDAALKHPCVEDLAALTGQFDIILKVRVKDNDELSDFLFSAVRNFPQVAATETLITLAIKKKEKK